jgi:hypothetical protein
MILVRFCKLCVFVAISIAATLPPVFVSPSIGSDSGDGSEASPFVSVGRALRHFEDLQTADATIVLLPGLYVGARNSNLTSSYVFRNFSLLSHLMGAAVVTVPNFMRVLSNGTVYIAGIVFDKCTGPPIVLNGVSSNITISDVHCTATTGPCLSVLSSDNILIQRSVFVNNSASSSQCALTLSSSAIQISDCTFIGNSGGECGAVFGSSVSLQAQRSYFARNNCGTGGGGGGIFSSALFTFVTDCVVPPCPSSISSHPNSLKKTSPHSRAVDCTLVRSEVGVLLQRSQIRQRAFVLAHASARSEIMPPCCLGRRFDLLSRRRSSIAALT